MSNGLSPVIAVIARESVSLHTNHRTTWTLANLPGEREKNMGKKVEEVRLASGPHFNFTLQYMHDSQSDSSVAGQIQIGNTGQ